MSRGRLSRRLQIGAAAAVLAATLAPSTAATAIFRNLSATPRISRRGRQICRKGALKRSPVRLIVCHTISHLDASSTSSPGFRKVNAARVSDAIVDQVKAALREGNLAPGDKLPPERELTKLFGVSRVAVRDALRLLEASGLIEVKVGAAGGAVITTPGSNEVAESISNMLLIRLTTPEEVTEARLVLEVGMIGLACERADKSDIADLYEICDRASGLLDAEGEYDVALSAEFHAKLAEATHNEVIAVLIASLHQPLEKSLRRAREVDPSMGRIGTREHREVVKAIEARDADKAGRIMRRHLLRTAKRLASAE